jgi:uncharacterized protein YciI
VWYLVLRRPVKPREEWTVNLDQHLVWMKEQHESGRVLFSGPTADRKLGVYVVRAGSKEEAHKIAQSDPYTAAGFCAFDLLEWEIHQNHGRRALYSGRTAPSPFKSSLMRDGGPITASQIRRR